MTVLALASVKHAPGVTTAAVSLAAAWNGDVVVMEADPSGGDVAARAHLAQEPGLLTLAAAGRRPDGALDLAPHCQSLPAGGLVVVAPSAPALASSAIATVASRLAATGRDLLVDCGRLFPASPAEAMVAAADVVLLVAEPTVTAVEHLRVRMPSPAGVSTSAVGVLLVGDRPYGPEEVEAALGVPVVGALAVDRRLDVHTARRLVCYRIQQARALRDASAGAVADRGDVATGRRGDRPGGVHRAARQPAFHRERAAGSGC